MILIYEHVIIWLIILTYRPPVRHSRVGWLRPIRGEHFPQLYRNSIWKLLRDQPTRLCGTGGRLVDINKCEHGQNGRGIGRLVTWVVYLSSSSLSSLAFSLLASRSASIFSRSSRAFCRRCAGVGASRTASALAFSRDLRRSSRFRFRASREDSASLNNFKHFFRDSRKIRFRKLGVKPR